MRWRAVYADGSIVEAPHYGRIDRRRPFSFEVYSTPLDLLPLLRIPVDVGDRLIHRLRHFSKPGVDDLTLVSVESEDRERVTVWIFTPEFSTWRKLDRYTEEFYAPDLLDFEDVVR